jgi:uncharacterized delta-60 repeat protein
LKAAVARLNSDGTLDANFDTDGKAAISVPGAQFYLDAVYTSPRQSLAIDSAGRLLVTGLYSSPTTGGDFAVVRLDPIGTLDGDFGSGGLVSVSFTAPDLGSYGHDTVSGIALDPSGRIVLAGTANVYGFAVTGPDFALARLNNDGTLDSTFDGDGRVITDVFGPSTDSAADLVITQPDGKIIVVGTSRGGVGSPRLAVLRYNVDGTLDSTFGTGGEAVFSAPLVGDASAAALDSAGRIILGVGVDVLRLNTGGTPDTSFGVDGWVSTLAGLIRDLVVDANDRIVIVDGGFGVTRLNTDGTPDPSFDGDGRVPAISFGPGTSGDAGGVAIDAAGRIIAAGLTYNPAGTYFDFAVARLNADGSLDTSFDTDGKTTLSFGTGATYDVAHDVTVDSANRIVVAGFTYNPITYADFAVVRFNVDGTLDASFGTGGQTTFNLSPSDDVAYAVAIDSAGYIVLAGSTTANYYTSNYDFAVALLKPDGCPDVDFGNGGAVITGFGPQSFDRAAGVAFDSAGRVVVVGTNHDGPSYYPSPSPTGSDIAVLRFLGHDPVVQANPSTVAADLQAAVTVLDTTTPIGTPRISLSVDNQTEMSAAMTALADLTVNPAGPVIEIMLDVGDGTYSLGSVSVPAGLELIIDGGGCPHSFSSASGPVLTLVSGDMQIRNGAIFLSTADAPTILVQGGYVSVRQSTIEETTVGSQAAIEISGGLVNLGNENLGGDPDTGSNTIHTHGVGRLIRNTGPNDVWAVGNMFLADGEYLWDNFRIEDAIDHAMDGLAGGLVTWMPNFLFVSANGGSIQRGVDVVPPAGIVHVEAGVQGNFNAGSKSVTVSFPDGAVMTQGIDTIDPTLRTLEVWGTWQWWRGTGDNIRFLTGDNAGEIQVNLNDLPHGTFQPTGRIIAHGQDGNDNIHVADGISLPAWLYGEYGDDRIKGGDGNDVILGGDGDDLLAGDDGRDLLIGGNGADRLIGNADDDILIAGYYRYEGDVYHHPPRVEAAVDAIMDEWTRTDRTAQQRVGALSSGGGLNGTYLLDATTIYDDFAADVLTGNEGHDWFLIGIGSDRITDLHDRAFDSDQDFLGLL